MKLGSFTKTPVERKRYTIDYTDWLDTGETLATSAFSISPSTGVAPLQVDASLFSTSNKELMFFVNYGDDDTTYIVDVQVTTSGGQTKEDQLVFTVRGL